MISTFQSVIQHGWPSTQKTFPADASAFWNIRSKLAKVNEIVFKGQRIIIPQVLRQETLIQLHAAHLSIEKTKQHAKMLVYWPGMNANIKSFIGQCKICARHTLNNQRKTIHQHRNAITTMATCSSRLIQMGKSPIPYHG